uniref:Uncharacterized protein n=1 Tax=Biston betularia TaxID=82595 RepID=E9KZF0_BISBE|nr:hypothetical protein AX11 [Biston betularia]
MELKPPKPKKKSNMARLISWGKMFKTPLLILFLLGSTNCENDSDSDISVIPSSARETLLASDSELKLSNMNLEMHLSQKQLNILNHSVSESFASDKMQNPYSSKPIFNVDSDISVKHLRHKRHRYDKEKLSEIRYLRRHLNKDIVNFVMSDVLMDGEVENRVHFNGITAKETYVGADG